MSTHDKPNELSAIHEAVMNPQAIVINEADTFTVKRVKEFIQRAVAIPSAVADTEPLAWLNADGVNTISEVERAKMEKGPFSWVLEERWKDATPLYAVASASADSKDAALWRQWSRQVLMLPDHNFPACSTFAAMRIAMRVSTEGRDA